MKPSLSRTWVGLVAIGVALAFTSLPASAQWGGGPHTSNTYNGHFLAPAPSVTSVGGAHFPAPAPSVTSLPNYPSQNFYGRQNYGYGPYRKGGYGYYGGFSYSVPYYYPPDTGYYGYDYVGNGGPDLYSGPPPGANDPILHIIVEQPPASTAPAAGQEAAEQVPPPATPAAPAPAAEVKPGEPTVLVFRNGHEQEVTNYAIMGDTLYVFDEGRKKIGLADLDIPATVKANDDRGMEFRVPPTAKKKATSTTPGAKPSATSDGQPPNIAALAE